MECSFKTNTTHYCAQLMLSDMGRYDQIDQKLKKTPSEVTSNNNHALHHKASIATCRFLEYKELLDLIKVPLLTRKINPHSYGKGGLLHHRLRCQYLKCFTASVSILLPNSLRFAANKTKKKEHHSGKHYEEHLWGSQRQYICACTF